MTEAFANFSAEWEVDRFAWPTECLKVQEIIGDKLTMFTELLIQQSYQSEQRLILVTGAQEQQGRSLLTLNLARQAASANGRIAIIDGDFDNPQIANYLGLEIEKGWDEVLQNGAPLAEAAIYSLEDNLTLFPLRDYQDGQESVDISSILEKLTTLFELIFVDAGQLGLTAEKIDPPVTPHPNAAAIIVAQEGSPPHEIEQIQNSLHLAGVRCLGTISTFANIAKNPKRQHLEATQR